MAHADDDLLTTSDVAQMARVRTRTVLAWAKDGRLPVAIVTPTGRVRFRRGDVLAALSPTSDAPQAAS